MMEEAKKRNCPKCGAPMLSSGIYDPDGTIPLYGGKKEYSEDGSLKEWWVCLNPACEDGKKNIVKG